VRKFFSPTNIVAMFILLAGILRLIYGGDNDGRFGETTLLYFFGAAAVFLFSRAKTFKFGDLEFELEQLKDQVNEATRVANIAQDKLKVEIVSAKEQNALPNYVPGTVTDDPWKGVFGGKSVDKKQGRVLSADVSPMTSAPGWYALTLKVSGFPERPLTGDVQFFLHDTFRNNRPVVKAVKNEAVLHLRAWGAFTVGAVCDAGACKLELDLSGLKGVPPEFRDR